MKVLYILHSTIMGGATLSFINLVKGLLDYGVSPVVVAPLMEEPFRSIMKTMGVTLYEVPVKVSIYPFKEGQFRMMNTICYSKKVACLLRDKRHSYKQLSNIIQKERPDIVHTNTGVVQEGFFAAKNNHIPHVWHLREYQDKDFGWFVFPSKGFLRRCLKKSNVISITKDILKSFQLLESSHHRVVYNGVLKKESTSLVFPKENYFLCASRVSPEKGIDLVIKAFSQFYNTHKDYRLKILGFGSDKYVESLRKLAISLSCADAIDFMGYQTNVADYMRKARGLIVASRCEGFGRMTAEACFCGCVVIGKDTGGTREILKETGGLLFTEEGDLLKCMEKLAMMDETDYKDVANNAANVACNLYSTEQNISNTYRFYKDILKASEKG